MTRRTGSITPDYFVDLYRGDSDPWGFATSDYERRKYAATLSALTRSRYRSGFEIGCANGVLTRQLAPHFDALLAVDVVPEVLDRARATCADLPQIEFRLMQVPDEVPDGQFELILLSEVGYYWDRARLADFARWAAQALPPSGELLLVHWTGETDYPLSGDEAHDAIIRHMAAQMTPIAARREPRYRLDLLRKMP
jgi:cyclopropane fatty-acyl-phospholipid synthase-like methyltransferase